MIGNITLSNNFTATVSYVMKHEKGYLIDKNLAGSTVKELIAEFEAIRKARRHISKPVFHASISILPEEHLTDEQWSEVAHYYLSKLGFENSQFIVVRHSDTKHPHIHIVANRIDLDGKTISDSLLYKRQEAIIRELEKQYNLTPLKSSLEAKKLKRQEPPAQKQARQYITQCINEIVNHIRQHKTEIRLPALITLLNKKGIKTAPNIASTGRISGLSFQYNNHSFKGSQLGKLYTWSVLQSKGIVYDPKKDLALIASHRKTPQLSQQKKHDRER